MMDEAWQSTPPDRDGWWEFDEHGMKCKQIILVIDGHVADDQDWEDAVGCQPGDTFSENYWEDNDVAEMTNGLLTRGVWRYLGKKVPREIVK